MKEPSVIKSKIDLSSLNDNSFTIKEPTLFGEVPPLINDPEAAELMKEKSESISEFINNLIKGNFFVGLVLISSMN